MTSGNARQLVMATCLVECATAIPPYRDHYARGLTTIVFSNYRLQAHIEAVSCTGRVFRGHRSITRRECHAASATAIPLLMGVSAAAFRTGSVDNPSAFVSRLVIDCVSSPPELIVSFRELLPLLLVFASFCIHRYGDAADQEKHHRAD